MTFIYILIFIAIFMAVFALSKSIDTKETLQRDFATKEKLKEWAEMSCGTKQALESLETRHGKLQERYNQDTLWGIQAYIRTSPIQYKTNRQKGEVYELKANIIKSEGAIMAGEKVLIEKATIRAHSGYVSQDYNVIGEKGIALFVSDQEIEDLFVTQKDYEDRIDEANHMIDKELEAIGDDNLIADLMDQNHILIKENERLTKEIDKCCKLNQELSRKLSVVPSPPKKVKKIRA